MEHAAIIEISGGIHQGGRLALPAGTTTVGSSLAADVVLSDDGVEARHCAIAVSKGRATIRGIDGEVRVCGRGRIGAGFQADVRLPATLELGAARMALEMPLRRTTARPLRPALFVGVFVLSNLFSSHLGVLGMGSAHVLDDPKIDDARARTDQSPEIRTAAASVEETATEPAVQGLAEVAVRISRELAGRGLSAIAVAVEADEIVASGTLPEDRRTDWLAFRQWVDSNLPGPVFLTGAVSFVRAEDSIDAVPVVQSVWAMGDRYVIVDDARVREGDTVRGGWRLTRIGDLHADFTRGSRSVRVHFGADETSDSR